MQPIYVFPAINVCKKKISLCSPPQVDICITFKLCKKAYFLKWNRSRGGGNGDILNCEMPGL